MLHLFSRFFLCGAFAFIPGSTARLDGNKSPQHRSNHEREVFENRIIGGSPADRGEFLYFVSWGGCAASLIAEDVILSAAHCAGIGSNDVIVGAQQRWWGQTSGDAERRTISERRSHPEYDSSTFANDFLVMKLTEPVTHIKPVTLNGDAKVPVVDEIVTAIGFGAVFEGGWGPRLLQEVDIQYVSHEQCNLEYDGDIVEDVMLCAGSPGGGKDSCQGDSGGPLIMKVPEGHVQIGVVSWGYGCARAEYSGVYSRVSGGKEWIDQQVCELSDNPPSSCKNTGNNVATPTAAPVILSGTQTNNHNNDSRVDCPDSETEEFHVDDINGMQGCTWLSENITEYGYLCKFVDVATTCPNLCDICDLMQQ